jgi:hypothetical protein
MSRVKQSLEEAKEFAASAAEAPDDDGAVPDVIIAEPPAGTSTFITDINGNPIAFASEQELVNQRLRNAVVGVEEDAVKLATKFIDQAKELKKSSDENSTRRGPAATEYRRIFEWPRVDDVAFSVIHTELSLSVAVDELLRCSGALDQVTQAVSPCGALLVELSKFIQTLRRKGEVAAELQALHVALLQDPQITQDVVMELHDLAQGDVFAFVRSQIAPMQRAIENMRDDISRTAQAKTDAEAVDDMIGIERASYRLVDLSEEVITKIDERLREIFSSDADIKAFGDKYEDLRQTTEQSLAAHESVAKERAAKLSRDLEALGKARVAKEAADAAASDQHFKRMETLNAEIIATNQKQSAAWEIIFQQFDILKALANERQSLVTRQVQGHAEECQRSANVEAWLRGAESYISTCKRTNDFTTAQLSWLSQIRSFYDTMCVAIENKNVDEEAWNMRVQEQLDYLDAYRDFKLRTNEIVHRKDQRVQSLQRLTRNLQLSIQEATLVLDPNKKRYESEMQKITEELQLLNTQIDALSQRAKKQQKAWKSVEEQLEDSQVDFSPPDIAVDKVMCELKAESLAVVRAFVSTEQETVDKDTMKLRKLKTNNQVSIEGFNKRRDERLRLQIEAVAAPHDDGARATATAAAAPILAAHSSSAKKEPSSEPSSARVTFPNM